MSGRHARPVRVRTLLLVTALLGAGAGVSGGSTWAALSDTETAATQTITAATCFEEAGRSGRCRGGVTVVQGQGSDTATATPTVTTSPSATPTATTTPRPGNGNPSPGNGNPSPGNGRGGNGPDGATSTTSSANETRKQPAGPQ